MKKIVSTMFKCGAICASLTTAFADGTASSSDQSHETSVVTDASTNSRGEPLSNVLTDDDKREKTFKILSKITENLINHPGESISLIPNDIRIDGEEVFFSKSQEQSFGDIRDLMQIKENSSPNQALAALSTYILNPGLRICFKEPNRIRVTPDGIFKFRSPRGIWFQIRAEHGNVYVTIIQLLYNNIPIELFRSYIDNYSTIMTLLRTIQNSAMHTCPEERQKAREYIEGVRQDFLKLLYDYSPTMMLHFYLLKAAESGDKEEFYKLAKKSPVDTIILLKGCSTDSIEECRRTGRMQISPNAMEIFENWKYNELVGKLKIAVNEVNRDRRSLALKEAIEIYDCNAPEQQERLEEDYPELLPMATLIQLLDLEDGERFLEYADSYPREAFDILSKYCSRKIQFSSNAGEILRQWGYENLAPDLQIQAYRIVSEGLAISTHKVSTPETYSTLRNP